jgi:hypothetical protein
MTASYKAAYIDYHALNAICQALLNVGVPKKYYRVVAVCLRASEDEITKIEDANLQSSEKKYKPILKHLKDAKDEMTEMKENAEKIVKAANQADQLIGILARVIPLIP